MATIKQKTVVIDIEGGPRIEVRRMRWKAAQDFLGKIAAVIVQLYREGKLGEVIAAPGIVERLAALDSLVGQAPALITQSEELTSHLMRESTDLTPEQLAALDLLAASEVLKAALELNTGDELKNCWAGIAVAVKGLMPARKPVATPTN